MAWLSFLLFSVAFAWMQVLLFRSASRGMELSKRLATFGPVLLGQIWLLYSGLVLESGRALMGSSVVTLLLLAATTVIVMKSPGVVLDSGKAVKEEK